MDIKNSYQTVDWPLKHLVYVEIALNIKIYVRILQFSHWIGWFLLFQLAWYCSIFGEKILVGIIESLHDISTSNFCIFLSLYLDFCEGEAKCVSGFQMHTHQINIIHPPLLIPLQSTGALRLSRESCHRNVYNSSKTFKKRQKLSNYWLVTITQWSILKNLLQKT